MDHPVSAILELCDFLADQVQLQSVVVVCYTQRHHLLHAQPQVLVSYKLSEQQRHK